jgi:EF-P beta-lysylation protein EpmB
MIPLNAPHWQTTDWQQQYRDMIRSPEQLWQRLALDPGDRPDIQTALADFPLRVTEAFVAKMQPGDWNDPLLLQILPQAQELNEQPGYSNDPLQEAASNPVPGLIHKYRGRVLMVTTPACAVHCRYCFRRAFPYNDNRASQDDWRAALDYISAHPEINEVILSGGDPLSAPDDYLHQLVDRLAALPQINTLRLHTRLPLVLPARITHGLIDALTRPQLHTVIVVHANHPNEVDSDTVTALLELKRAGFTLFNQSVLLKGVNDCAKTLTSLSKQLFDCGVLPYYLHVLDKVNGAGHFHVDDAKAQQIMQQLLASLPGYLVPRLVREEPGQRSKTPLALR